MQLTSNRRQIQLNLMLGDGRHRDITFEPEDLLYDAEGVVRLISIQYNDGTVGNYKLLPNNETADRALEIIGEWLLPFGLSIAAGRIFQGRSNINNLSRFMTNKVGGNIVKDVCDRVRIQNCSYYATDNGELVIHGPIVLR